jgi:PAS domain S-box-containing protein
MLMRIPQSAVFRYGIALVFVGAALALSLLFHRSLADGFLIFFLSAVMLAGWFGRTGAGLFAVVVSMMIVDYYFIAPYRALAVEIEELPYLLSFLLSAVVTSWLAAARRTAEEKHKAHLDELFEQSPEAIIFVDLHDRVIRVNKEFTHIFGYESGEAVNHSCTELIVPVQLRDEALEMRKRLVSGQHVSLETLRKRKDGADVHVSEVAFPVIANGKSIGLYMIFRDITASRQALDELQKAQAELAHLSRITTMGELAASIAHEINQPIGAIVTNGNAAVRWLAQVPPNVEGAEESVEFIVRDANRAAEVIGRIRSLLSKDATPMVSQDMNEIVREVLALTAFETKSRDVRIQTDLDKDLPSILGDRVQLQQVVLNVVMNSLDAMNSIDDRSRELCIRSSRNVDSVVIQIKDTGHGLDASCTDSIFEPFFTTKKGGIGMGLKISRSIIEVHGGRMWAEPGRPHGAIVSFSLPIEVKAE